MFNQDNIFFFFTLGELGKNRSGIAFSFLAEKLRQRTCALPWRLRYSVRHTLKETGFPSWGTGKSALAVVVSTDLLGPRWVVEGKEEDAESWPVGPTRRAPCFSPHQLFMVLGRSASGR